MSGSLLDVNVLIALTWPTHVHHAAARRWFDRNSGAGWATCPITQLGFVRVSSNPKIIRDAVPPREAVAMLERLVALPEHRFWPNDIAVAGRGPFASLAFVGHRQATDAYLLALAQHHEGKLATLDRGIVELIAERDQRARWVDLVPS
ncbi:MAG TPA: TA system VapC family ribonuclease toxin [Gammaproteobacteria bacterium]|nr:TA system VapC family ribonuclease toxin [Gammaproteobacteria bacterium]